MLTWLSVWSKVQIIWSGRCHCHFIILCIIKIQNLPFWCQLTQPPVKKAIKWVFVLIITA